MRQKILAAGRATLSPLNPTETSDDMLRASERLLRPVGPSGPTRAALFEVDGTFAPVDPGENVTGHPVCARVLDGVPTRLLAEETSELAGDGLLTLANVDALTEFDRTSG